MPLTRTRLKPSATAVSRASRSPGVHTTPRTKTRSPLTQRSSESADLFSTVRVPAGLGVPWLCGHQVPSAGCASRSGLGGQHHRPVGPDHRRARREARRAAQDLRAHPAQPGLLDDHRPPACAWLARQLVEQLGQRVHHDPHLVVPRAQRAGDVDRPALEHRATRRHDLTVDQDVPDRGDAADLQGGAWPGRPPRRARPTRAGRRPRPDPARG